MATLDEQISSIQNRLDMLRNKDYVPEQQRRLYYRSIADAELQLRQLLEQKEQQNDT